MSENKKTEFEQYRDTGILGGYQPELVTGQVYSGGKIMPIFQDSLCVADAHQIKLSRQMIVGSRVFTVRSYFSTNAVKTATDNLLRIIDSDLVK